MMADDGLKISNRFDAIYFGAVGFPTVPDHISLRGLRLPICQGSSSMSAFAMRTAAWNQNAARRQESGGL